MICRANCPAAVDSVLITTAPALPSVGVFVDPTMDAAFPLSSAVGARLCPATARVTRPSHNRRCGRLGPETSRAEGGRRAERVRGGSTS